MMSVAIGVPVLVIGVVIGGVAALGNECDAQTPSVALDSVPAGPISGFDREQLLVAAAIINDGASRAAPLEATTFAIAAAIADSDLAAAPPSSFLSSLLALENWDTIDPAAAINAVQGSADPLAYADALPLAESLTAELAGQQQPCAAGAPGQVSADGWAAPAGGGITSGFGIRIHPVTGERKMHYGVDYGPGCGSPIYAATSGRVVFAGPSGGYGNLITIDHGNGVQTRYAHMFSDGIFVKVGDDVAAGQNIAAVGNSGLSTGCHLHFELRVNGTAVDPEPVLASVGAGGGQ